MPVPGIPASRTGYAPLQIALHWLIAVGIVFNYIVSDGMGRALNAHLSGGVVGGSTAGLHVWIGVGVLLLAVIRLGLRLRLGAPPAAPGMAGLLASGAHWALYALIFLVPLAGAVAWFGGIDAAGDVHAVLANLLMLLAALHALAGLGHQFVLKDGVLMRMFRPE